MKVLILSFFAMMFANQGFAQNSAHVVTFLDSLDGYRYEVHADMYVLRALKEMVLENLEMKRVGIENEELLPLLGTYVEDNSNLNFLTGICQAFSGPNGNKSGFHSRQFKNSESQDQQGYTLENYLNNKVFFRKWSLGDLNEWIKYLSIPENRKALPYKELRCRGNF